MWKVYQTATVNTSSKSNKDITHDGKLEQVNLLERTKYTINYTTHTQQEPPHCTDNRRPSRKLTFQMRPQYQRPKIQLRCDNVYFTVFAIPLDDAID